MKPLPCLYHVSTTAIFVEKAQHGGGVQHRISAAARWLTIKYRRCLLSGAAAMAIWSGQWGCRLRCAMSENQVRHGAPKALFRAVSRKSGRRTDPRPAEKMRMSWRDSIKCVIVGTQSPKVPYRVAFDFSSSVVIRHVFGEQA